MYRILSASKDTYITNKIINNRFRATDANVGEAATIDIFKLYGESTLSGSSTPIELSRGLVKFDLSPIRQLTSSNLDISHSSFKCYLKLHDIYGGQTTPSNFNILVFPLSQSFDEGVGRDIISFSDLDACNWVTASVTSENSPVKWFITGANSIGLLGSSDIDVISSGNLNDGSGIVSLFAKQTFSTGEEDLYVDVTNIISATIVNLIPDHGFRISYSGTYADLGTDSAETDSVTRYVKRFASRNTANTRIRPKLIVKYNDTVQDHHESFFFNVSGSLFLNNFHRGKPANIVSGSSLTEIKGDNCIILRIESGSNTLGTLFRKYITGSQHKVGNNFITGVYSASFAVSDFESSALLKQSRLAGSASFKEYWESTANNDLSTLGKPYGYYTGSFNIDNVNRTSFGASEKRYYVSIINLESRYRNSDKVKLRVYAEDVTRPVKYKKIPFYRKSQIFTNMHYRVKDFDSNDIIIPFDKEDNSTLLSTDSEGMFFEFYMSSLPKGRTYIFELLITSHGFDQVFTSVTPKFSVD